MNLSSEELRIEYERFYDLMRNYLWDYDTLTTLADVEDSIFIAFISPEVLSNNLNSLGRAIREVMKDDEELSKSYDALIKLTDDASNPDAKMWLRLPSVNEVNPENDKELTKFGFIEEEEEPIDENIEETVSEF